LKPFGLASILTTDCGVINGRKRTDLHFKSSQLTAHACPVNSRLVCLCHIGREIGFNPQVFSTSLSHALSIETFQPSQMDPGDKVSQVYHYEVPGITSRVVGEVNGEGPYQVFSEGSLELVLESCGDYWNGVELGSFNESIEKKIYELATNAIISDLQVVGFSYRPLQNPPLWSQIRSLKRKDPYYIYIPNAPPINQAKIIHDTSLMDSPVKLSTTDSVAPSASPHNMNPSKIKKRTNLDRLVSKLDSQVLANLHETEICKEITKGQTFLCAATFVYPPKPNMVDFVEDLGLGGIRFVYFSASPERESKAYAERLGLEIDWNSCIILSPDNGSGTGYLALHDMKAQLPRGVDTIREHIANVDDVPLHVSLFAESKPASIREMCKIFQENGEVVCCIGSSLNDLNIECFVNADISIAVDPIPLHRHKVGHGPLSPLIVSSLMNSSPCALSLNADSSLYSITQMIREARSLSENGKQAFAFYIGAQIGLSAVILMGFCTLLPLVMEVFIFAKTIYVL
jgi:phosphoserine phosphatase